MIDIAKKANIGATIGLDGEKEFRQAISGINSDMKVLASEMKKVSAEFIDNNNSVEALSAKDEVLNKQLDKQKEKVEALKLALQNAQEQYGENDTKTDKWKISLNNAEAEMSKLTKEIKDNKEAMEQAKNPTDNLAEEIKDVGKQADTAGEKSLKMGDIIKANLISDAIIGGVKSLASAFTSVVGGIGDAVDKTVEYASNISDAAQKTGLSTTALQEYNYAASQCGLETEAMEKAMIKSQTSFAKAKDGSKTLKDAYSELGIDINKISNSSDAFDATISALADMGDTTQANAIASQLFGKSYADLKPLLAEGAKGISDLKGKAQELGIVMSEDAVTSGEALGDTMDTVKQQISGVANSFISTLLPGISEFVSSASEYLTGFSGEIQAANGDMGKIGEVIGSSLSDIVGKIAEKLPEIIQGAKSLVSSFIGGITESLPSIISTGTSMLTDLIASLYTALPGVVEVGLDVITNLINGITQSLPELIPVAIDSVLSIVDAILNNLDPLIEAALEMILALADGLVDALPKLVDKIPTIITGLIKAITDNLPKIIETGIVLIVKLAAGLIKAIPNLLKAVPEIIFALVKGFGDMFVELINVGKDLVKNLWKGITDLSDWIGKKIGGFAGDIISSVTDGIAGIKTVGKNLVEGLWNGIDDMTDWIVNKVKGFGGDVLSGIKNFFGIKSPSTVFRDEVGIYLAQGIGVGFTNEMSKVTNEMNNSIPTNFEMSGLYNVKSSFTSENRMMLSAIGDLYEAITNISGDIILRIGNEDIARANKRGAFSLNRRYSAVMLED